MEFSKLRTDKNLEENGREIVLKRDVDGNVVESITVARHNNPKFTEYLSANLQQYQYAMSQGVMDASVLEDVTIRGMARHILKGWKGWTDGGEAVPFSVEAAEKYLKEIPDFLEIVARASKETEGYRAAAVDEAAKNSGPVSVGS